MKKCARCGALKPLDQFYRMGRNNDYSARCRDCHGIAVRTCAVCGAEFEGLAARKFCSKECRQKARPRATILCQECGSFFHPDKLARKFCSNECKARHQKTGRRRKFIPDPAARAAHSRVSYAIKSGTLSRPDRCEDCGKVGKPEAAHYDYADPLRVRWLCRSCHVKWDKAEPKGGGSSIDL